MVVLLCELDLPCVELTNSGYLKMAVNNSRCLSLSLRENNVHEVLCTGDHSDLEVVVRHLKRTWVECDYFL